MGNELRLYALSYRRWKSVRLKGPVSGPRYLEIRLPFRRVRQVIFSILNSLKIYPTFSMEPMRALQEVMEERREQ